MKGLLSDRAQARHQNMCRGTLTARLFVAYSVARRGGMQQPSAQNGTPDLPLRITRRRLPPASATEHGLVALIALIFSRRAQSGRRGTHIRGSCFTTAQRRGVHDSSNALCVFMCGVRCGVLCVCLRWEVSSLRTFESTPASSPAPGVRSPRGRHVGPAHTRSSRSADARWQQRSPRPAVALPGCVQERRAAATEQQQGCRHRAQYVYTMCAYCAACQREPRVTSCPRHRTRWICSDSSAAIRSSIGWWRCRATARSTRCSCPGMSTRCRSGSTERPLCGVALGGGIAGPRPRPRPGPRGTAGLPRSGTAMFVARTRGTPEALHKHTRAGRRWALGALLPAPRRRGRRCHPTGRSNRPPQLSLPGRPTSRPRTSADVFSSQCLTRSRGQAAFWLNSRPIQLAAKTA